MIEKVELMPEESGLDKVDIWLQYCEGKFNIFQMIIEAENFEFETMAEIGFRSGYGAYMFLKQKPDMKYIGFDNLSSVVGTPGIKWGQNLLKDFDVRIDILDTQQQSHLDIEPVDFFHLDASHTKIGIM